MKNSVVIKDLNVTITREQAEKALEEMNRPMLSPGDSVKHQKPGQDAYLVGIVMSEKGLEEWKRLNWNDHKERTLVCSNKDFAIYGYLTKELYVNR